MKWLKAFYSSQTIGERSEFGQNCSTLKPPGPVRSRHCGELFEEVLFSKNEGDNCHPPWGVFLTPRGFFKIQGYGRFFAQRMQYGFKVTGEGRLFKPVEFRIFTVKLWLWKVSTFTSSLSCIILYSNYVYNSTLRFWA